MMVDKMNIVLKEQVTIASGCLIISEPGGNEFINIV